VLQAQATAQAMSEPILANEYEWPTVTRRNPVHQSPQLSIQT
jgi:hypothetical protein